MEKFEADIVIVGTGASYSVQMEAGIENADLKGFPSKIYVF